MTPTAHPHPRIQREARTIQIMIAFYCQQKHRLPEGALCPSCAELSTYALARLQRCPFQPAKPACARCRVHCYQPKMRLRIREVMRFSGPRMLLRHPYLAITHMLDDLRNRPK